MISKYKTQQEEITRNCGPSSLNIRRRGRGPGRGKTPAAVSRIERDREKGEGGGRGLNWRGFSCGGLLPD